MTALLPWVFTWAGFHVLCFGLVCLHCLQHRREATSTILWIFTAWSFPLFGPLLYITIGVDRAPQKGFDKQTHDEKMTEAGTATDASLPMAYWKATGAESVYCPTDKGLEKNLCDIISAVAPEYPLLKDNTIVPHVTGDELYPHMLQAIDKAEHHIHLQSFIIRNDPVGCEFMEHLAAKAKAGVQVRLLYDRFGSSQALFTGLFRKYKKTPNFKIAGWTQVSLLKRQFQLNLRNHRKSLIIDGNHAFMGGINIHKENTTRGNIQPIRDYHTEVTGPIVQEIQFAFMKDWHFITNESPQTILQSAYFPAVAKTGEAFANIICGGPTHNLQPITEVFFMAITRALKQLLIVTPYFVPTYDIMRALRSAAIRGVDVRLIIPAKNNHIYAGWAARALYEELMQAGVRIFERSGPFIHAKAMLVDDTIAFVGTANWDVRSLRLNYETIMAVHNEAFANSLKRIILDDEAQSSEINLTTWQNRPAWYRLAENACSLMTPVL